MSEEQPGIHSERVYLVELTPTAKRLTQPDDFARILSAHLAWVGEQQAAGRIWATGPVVNEETNENTGEGIFIIRAAAAEAAAELVSEDPQVVGGFKTFRVRPWMLRMVR